MVKEQNPVLLVRPGSLLYVRVQMVVPPFSALLAFTSWQVHGDGGPFLRPEPVHKF